MPKTFRSNFLSLLVVLSTGSALMAAELPAAVTNADYRPVDAAQAALGRFLFYDKILSGNQNIACATCHHHDHASSDGLSLGVGEGGVGLGPKRVFGEPGITQNRRIPRHSPTLFNLGAREFTRLFHDGRVFEDPTDATGFNSPAEEFLPEGLTTVTAVQALFPLLSEVEMAGQTSENPVARAILRRQDYAWNILVERIQAINEYLPLFRDAFADIKKATDISITHIANAIGAFVNSEWRADSSPFDAYLRGDEAAFGVIEKRGLELFYGKGGCAACHSGKFQTDHEFHAIAMPQFGPGRTRMFDPVVRDRGRINETDEREDSHKFRTPSLRNVAISAPYGHTGAYRTLEAVVRHHLNPVAAFRTYDPGQTILPPEARLAKVDFLVFENTVEQASIIAANELEPVDLTDREVTDLIAFLRTLTDGKGLKGRFGAPQNVPSGLPLDE